MSGEPENMDEPQGSRGDSPSVHVESGMAAAPENVTIIVQQEPVPGSPTDEEDRQTRQSLEDKQRQRSRTPCQLPRYFAEYKIF